MTEIWQQLERGEEADVRSSASADAQPEERLRVVTETGTETISLETAPAAAPVRDPKAPSTRLDASTGYRALAWILAGSDILCLAAALVIAQFIAFGVDGRYPMSLPAVLVSSALWLAVFHGFGLYAPQHLSAPEIFRRVIGATGAGTLILFLVSLGTVQPLSRKWVGLTWLIALFLELATRRVGTRLLYKLRAEGQFTYRTLIVGTNAEAARLAATLRRDPSLGYQMLGHVSTGQPIATGSASVLGSLATLDELINRYEVDCLFVASSAIQLEHRTHIQRTARRTGAEIRFSANLPETLTTRLSVKPVGDLMSISLRPVYLTGAQAGIKRAFDLLCASVGLIVCAPLFAVIALAIKLTSPGPVLFRQERITSGGRVFTVYKFRTMVADTDRILHENSVDKSEAFFKIRNGDHITRVGHALRRLSLDELPQLWNIARGDMSLVGPRPLPAEQVSANLELLEARHDVRAGLTGWWQIHGRSDVDPEEAVAMDLFYIENWSLLLDLYIIFKTMGAVVAKRGAY